MNAKSKIKNFAKLVIGYGLLAVMPQRGQQLATQGFTLDLGIHFNRTDRLIRYALLHKTSKRQSNELVDFHRTYWEKRGKEYYDANLEWDVFNQYFMPNLSFIIDKLAERVGANLYYTTLCEIGVGNGQVLAYAASKLPSVQRFIGLDLNQEQVVDNCNKYPDSKFEFVACEASEWIQENAEENWIFLTNQGVLEYFERETLQGLFSHISNHLAPALFVVVEPYGTGHDIENDVETQTYGPEFSYSHNYRHLFIEAGFKVWHYSTLPVNDNHNLCIVGVETA
ncbi:MAG: class I SAM-dependent methyltransferase [Chloroflexi bacterium]|nr:MAG: class I SAM-dependent methyltransferase [Chloroflexota bacterium]